MSACDRRTYYPTPNGLFKLRSSDGDLVWECRPVSYGLSTLSLYNFTIRKAGSKVYLAGMNGENPAAIVVTEDGDGLVSDVSQFDPFPVAADVISDSTIVGCFDLTDDYAYLAGELDSAPDKLIVARYDLDGSVIDSTVVTTGGQLAGFRAVNGGSQFDLVRLNQPNALGSMARYDAGNSTPVATVAPCFFSIDNDFLIPSDGSTYYSNGGKIDIATFGVTGGMPVGGTFKYAVRDGYIAACGGAVSASTTGGAGPLWTSAAFTRSTGVAVCDDFAAAVGLTSGFNPGLATSFAVKRFNHDGSEAWSRTLLASDDRGLDWRRFPSVTISDDKEKVYVYGPFSHSGLAFNSLKLSLYCLSASDGSVIWRFSGGPSVDVFGTNSQCGMSVLDDGDNVYLSTFRLRAPTYR